MNDTLIIIPTYNEKENIEAIIRKVFSLEKQFDILVVEDNSPDGTADIVKRLMAEFPGRVSTAFAHRGAQGETWAWHCLYSRF